MRRKDREVTDQAEIWAMLGRCDTVRLGIQGEETPYVVPVSFGTALEDGQRVIYFHCAREGRKLELLQKHPVVCVEADRCLGIEPTAHGITARYESVIGVGTCELVEDEAAVIRGLKALLAHYGCGDYDLSHCGALSRTAVGRVVLSSLTGKHNLPEGV